ncbi:unnamed protein product [Danaus chrysippus]|uniref:(African queen) hypothetical protein n=1 Tax=Danaus chrysippus TaxID=151541 RepID=A0A8J2VUN2_9NEOP|nr:unnamed protein product [Danaus chrysippus]
MSDHYQDFYERVPKYGMHDSGNRLQAEHIKYCNPIEFHSCNGYIGAAGLIFKCIIVRRPMATLARPDPTAHSRPQQRLRLELASSILMADFLAHEAAANVRAYAT